MDAVTIVFAVIAGVAVFVIAAAVIGREAHRLDAVAPRSVYVLDEAVEDADPFDPALVAALSTLTDDQRQVVVLRHVADLSVEDVAAITGRTPSSVKMLTARGLEALAARLAPVPEGVTAIPSRRGQRGPGR